MIRHFCVIFLLTAGFLPAEEELRPILERTYGQWRNSMVTKNADAWKQVTALHRQIEVKNRILSEKKRFPTAIFDLPGTPPEIKPLKYLTTIRNGPTAKSYYFGKVDFGVGKPTQDNLLAISYIGSGPAWKYDTMSFVSLVSLDDVRKELSEGNLKYIKSTPELLPNGKIPAKPVEIQEPEFIAKVYVFCPNREVEVRINALSKHSFANDKQAELVIGGARSKQNLVQFSTKPLDGGTGKEAMTIRVYLMSQVVGVKPVKIYEYLVNQGEAAEAYGTGSFSVDGETKAYLEGRR